MKNILVIGSTGQIGSELTMELRKRYGDEHVVAGYIAGAEPKGALAESGPKELADVTDGEAISEVSNADGADTAYQTIGAFLEACYEEYIRHEQSFAAFFDALAADASGTADDFQAGLAEIFKEGFTENIFGAEESNIFISESEVSEIFDSLFQTCHDSETALVEFVKQDILPLHRLHGIRQIQQNVIVYACFQKSDRRRNQKN